MALPAQAINGRFFQFSSIELNLDGNRIVGFTSINYTCGLEPGKVMGAAIQPMGTTRGEWSSDGDIEMHRSTFRELLDLFGDGWMEKEFDIAVSFSEDGLPVETDDLIRCRFKNVENSHSTGTDGLKVKLGLHIEAVLINGKLPYAGFRR